MVVGNYLLHYVLIWFCFKFSQPCDNTMPERNVVARHERQRQFGVKVEARFLASVGVEVDAFKTDGIFFQRET